MQGDPPEKVRRILMTADTVGGVWTYALELCEGLGRRGVHVVLCTMGRPLADDQWEDAKRVRGLEICESGYRLEWMDDPWDDVARAGEWLLEIAGRVRPDVVHLNNFCHGALPWPAPALMVGHSCVLSWFEAVKDAPAPPAWERYREEVTRGLRAVQRVIAPSRDMLSALERHYGPFASTRVIPNARARVRFAPAAVKEPFVLSAGRLWDEAKNVGALAEIAAGLPWPVKVAGEEVNPSRPDATPEARTGVEGLGRLSPDALAELMARAAIYALPARYEPFGLSALEAAMSGCALVLGDIPSLREVWGDAALFVPPEEPAALQRALLKLIGDDALRIQMAHRARARAARYDAGAFAEAWLEEYVRLSSSPPSPVS